MYNSRDEKLCQYLLSYGFLSSEQIKKLLFPETNKRTILRRLRILNKKKVLVRFESSKGGTILWTLSRMKVQQLGSEFVMKSINRSTLAHDLLVNDLRIQFDQKGVGSSWKSGHYFRFKASLGKSPEERLPDTIPDWIVTIKNKVCALEVELNLKSTSRIQRVLNLYYRKESIAHLWYFVPNEKMRQRLMKIALPYEQYRGKGWFKVSLLRDVEASLELLTGTAHSVSRSI